MAARGGASTMASMGEENIYNWIKREAEAPPKPKMYRSKFRGKATDVTYSTLKPAKTKLAAATMGRTVKGTVNPKKFLKRGEKMPRAADPRVLPKRFKRKDPVRKPPVPSKDDRPVLAAKGSKDYVVSNALENILAVPPQRPAEPDYRHKEDYGKVPEYLEVIKQEVEEEKELFDTMIAQAELQEREDHGEAVARRMPEEEREELLEALKAKWDDVNEEYQKISHQTISTSNATIGQVRKKEECERQLDQLEKDIERLSKKGPIFVVD